MTELIERAKRLLENRTLVEASQSADASADILRRLESNPDLDFEEVNERTTYGDTVYHVKPAGAGFEDRPFEFLDISTAEGVITNVSVRRQQNRGAEVVNSTSISRAPLEFQHGRFAHKRDIPLSDEQDDIYADYLSGELWDEIRGWIDQYDMA